MLCLCPLSLSIHPSTPHPPLSLSLQPPQERYKSIPDDIARDLRGVLLQLRKHEALVHVLAGNEQQVLNTTHQ